MRHNIFRRKIKSSLILLVAGVVLVSTLFASSLGIHQAHAATSSQGDLTTAHQKLLAMAFDHCLRGAYMQIANKANLVDNKKIFTDGIDQWAHYSLYVEKVAGANGADNGSIRCGEGNDKLTSGMLSTLGITYQDLICDHNDHAKGGLVKIKAGYTCSQALTDGNGFDGFKSRSDMRNYFEELITSATFNGSDKVPGGSIWTLTPIEEYMTYQEAYLEMCAKGSAVYGDSASSLRNIIVWNSSTKRFEHAGHSNNRDDGYKVETYEDRDTDVGHSYSCKDLASVLNNPAQSPTKNYIDYMLSSVKDSCNSKYDEEYDKIKDWVVNNSSSFDGNAEADVSTFLNEYKRNSTNKWRLESDGINVTCNGLDSMKSRWEDIKRIRGLNDAPSIDSDVPYSPSGTADSDGHGNGTATTCSSASGAVGWFICPILEFAASTSVKIYEDFIEPSLETNPAFFRVDGEYNGTYQAWQTFRDVANIVFAIFLLFIIFSQVTGIGIDNYGIKKSLPKLIIAVILVNISFYICQFLIDISNIAGGSLYGLINSIGDKITVPVVYGQGLKYASSVTFSIFALVAGGAAVAAFWTAIAGALLATIPTLIGALIGILFFFFLLGMRQTVVVLLVAISPLAFVCYALPNTKNLFDRWAQILRGMLLLYPICSLMVAGGRLVSKIILASGGAGSGSSLFFILVAMIAEIGPLFMIPGITRSAYQATGQLGTALNGLRGRMTGGARNITRNNRAYQRAIARNERNRANSRAIQRRLNRYSSSENKNQADRTLRDRWRLRRGNQERIAEINQARLKAEEEQRRIDQLSDTKQVLGMSRAARAQQEAQVGRNDAWAEATDAQIAIALDAARAEAKTGAQKQMISSANYADADFNRAIIRQAETENSNARERQKLWNEDRYREGKENANVAAIASELENTRLWTHENYIKGKLNASQLATENESLDTELMANGGVVNGRREQARIARDATRQNAEHYNDATYQSAAAAALQRKERDENIKSRESLLANGQFTYTADGKEHTVNGFRTDEVRDALKYALSNQYTGDNREADIHALVNTLSMQGDAGRSAVYEALQDTEENGGGINNDARKQLAQNIMQYHAPEYKNNQRSVFDYARANTGDEPAEIEIRDGSLGPTRPGEVPKRQARFADYSAHATGSLNQEMLVNMDESELQRYFNALSNTDPTKGPTLVRRSKYANVAELNAAEVVAKNQLIELARSTLANTDVIKNLKGSQRRIIEDIAKTPTPTPTPASTPTPAPTPTPTPTPAPTPTPNPEPQPQPPRPQSDQQNRNTNPDDFSGDGGM